MERIQDLRNVTPPDGRLAWRDVRSQLVTVNTGKFARNCVLTGKSATEMDYPIYIREPGLISPAYDVYPDGLGYFDASEGTAANVKPMHHSNVYDSNYWEASTLGAWIAYHHELRPTMIRGYRFVTFNGYTPRIWRVEGSNDNATWTTLHSVTVDWTWGDGIQTVEQEIPLENRDYFTHHRLIVDEFDAAAIRIYYLQFWDSLCASPGEFYLDADAENPLQISFADGFNTDGTPKNIPVTINTGIQIDATQIMSDVELLMNDNPIPCALYAKYDPNTSTTSFLADVSDAETIRIEPESMGMEVIATNLLSTEIAEIFDNSLSSGGYFNSSKYVRFSVQPFYASMFWANLSSTGGLLKISEDYGNTWTSFTMPSGTNVTSLGRTYHVTQFQFLYNGSSFNLYEFRFCKEPPVTDHKMSNGRIYEYDPVAGQWNHVYKVPLGYFQLWKNPDGSSWEIASFVPTFVPSMTVAPSFRRAGLIH